MPGKGVKSRVRGYSLLPGVRLLSMGLGVVDRAISCHRNSALLVLCAVGSSHRKQILQDFPPLTTVQSASLSQLGD
jgi:hypothetical protein